MVVVVSEVKGVTAVEGFARVGVFFSGSWSSFFVIVGGWKGEGGMVELSSEDTLRIVVVVVAWVSSKV